MDPKENKAFCILPWLHLQVKQDGQVYPCCRQTGGFSYGSTKTESLSQIWNSEKIKKVRKEMLEGKVQTFCSDCHKMESLGSLSYRNRVNQVFVEDFSRLQATDAEGKLEHHKINYLDIRFSNVCNYKCRTCNSENSSLWYEEEQLIKRNFNPKQSKTIYLSDSNANIMSEIEELIPDLKYIYFAGGEPLLHEEHYLLLRKLISLRRTDVVISYNTNLSKLSYKKFNVLELWSKFQHVHISASIDAIGSAAELIRKGTSWSEVEKNLKLIRTMLPNAFIEIFPTVSILNCFSLTELIRHFLKSGLLKKPNQFSINILEEPEHLNIAILNENEISKLKLRYESFISDISKTEEFALVEYLQEQLEIILKAASKRNFELEREKFINFTKILDEKRRENSAAFLKELELEWTSV